MWTRKLGKGESAKGRVQAGETQAPLLQALDPHPVAKEKGEVKAELLSKKGHFL